MRRPRVVRVVASRGLELEVTIRGSGTLAASALARHCEATGVSLPRKGRVHESVRGQSPSNSSGLQWLLWQGLITGGPQWRAD